MTGQVALVTGASRGTGKACAIELADAGFDIAITARTVTEGEIRERSGTVKKSDFAALPGSLQETTTLLDKMGARAMAIPADLLDPASLGAAVTKVLERWGRIDVVVHSGRYVGPGHKDRFLDTPMELLRKQMEANVFAPMIINQLVLPQMIARGRGTIINLTSGAAFATPIKPAGAGGWGMGYSITKGAFHRMAGILKTELGDQGIRCFNLEPGLVRTEQHAHEMGKAGADAPGAPPIVPAKVVRWLCTNPEADALNGETIEAQHFCYERALFPGWPGPYVPEQEVVVYDLSGYRLQQLSRTGHR